MRSSLYGVVLFMPGNFLDVELKGGMVSLFVVIGIVCWPGVVRVVRAQVTTQGARGRRHQAGRCKQLAAELIRVLI